MNPLDRMLAIAQIVLTSVLFAGLFWLLTLVVLGHAATLPEWGQKILSQSLRFIEDGGMVAIGFWLNRQRAGGISDTITQTQTSPDGSTTVIKSPSHVPPPPLPTAGVPTPGK